MLIRRLIGTALCFVVWVVDGHAACSGSGITWSCTAGSTIANVNSAISSSTTGATITLATGAYTWTSGTLLYDAAKTTTVICETVGACDVTLGTNTLLQHDDVNGATDSATQKTWRLSGLDFVSGACGTPCIWIYPRISQPTQYLTVRLDHNTFNGQGNSSDFMYLGEGNRPMYFRGSIDNNTWTNSTQTRMLVLYGTADPTDFASTLLGSSNCLFVEDNTVTFTAPDNNGAGFIDAENASCYVARFNSLTNARVLQHGVTHGWGTVNFEAYGNAFVRNTNSDSLGNCYHSVHMQGSGAGAFWGNSFDCFSAISGSAIDILHYRDTTLAIHGGGGEEQCDGTRAVDGNTSPTATHRGYPCKNQPGRSPAGGTPEWGTLTPIPVFKNVDLDNSNAKVDTNFSCPWSGTPYCTEHVQANRDYYNAVSATAQTSATSPFNGTTGIGHGTLANRPTTCTHTTAPDGDEGGGVMYWATDQGSWNSSSTNPKGVQQNGADGVLYRCSATNTWSTYYTPAAYPNTYRDDAGGGGGGSSSGGSMDVKVPDAPTMFVEYAYTAPPPQCPDRSYCMTLKGKARRQCLACQ